MESAGEKDEAATRKRAQRARKVLVFTLAMGVVVATGALGGLGLGLFLVSGAVENDPFLVAGLSFVGLMLSVLAVDILTKKLLTKWVA